MRDHPRGGCDGRSVDVQASPFGYALKSPSAPIASISAESPRRRGRSKGILVLGLCLAAMIGFAGEAAAASPSAGCGAAPPVAAGETLAATIEVGELTREYRLHLPTGYDPADPAPLVLVIHGYTGTAEKAEMEYTSFRASSDENGYVAVFPQGTGFEAGAFRSPRGTTSLATGLPVRRDPSVATTHSTIRRRPSAVSPASATGARATTTWDSSRLSSIGWNPRFASIVTGFSQPGSATVGCSCTDWAAICRVVSPPSPRWRNPRQGIQLRSRSRNGGVDDEHLRHRRRHRSFRRHTGQRWVFLHADHRGHGSLGVG